EFLGLAHQLLKPWPSFTAWHLLLLLPQERPSPAGTVSKISRPEGKRPPTSRITNHTIRLDHPDKDYSSWGSYLNQVPHRHHLSFHPSPKPSPNPRGNTEKKNDILHLPPPAPGHIRTRQRHPPSPQNGSRARGRGVAVCQSAGAEGPGSAGHEGGCCCCCRCWWFGWQGI
ncbi:uncharacterized protein BO72DRAFT_527381, partial [Aspergillus fijiensis CBS 313.89]